MNQSTMPKNLRAGTLCFALLLQFFIAGGTASFAQSALSLDAYGVWDGNDGSDFNSADSNYNYLHGISFAESWKDVQPVNEKAFDWKNLQTAIDLAYSRNTSIFIGVGVGPASPDWIYAAGVPKVTTNDVDHSWPYYPYYLDTNYKIFYYNLIRELGKFIQSQSLEKMKRVAFIQVKTGCTGDECAYKGETTDSQYTLTNSGEQWRNFRLEAFGVYKESFVNAAHPIPLLFNNIEFESYPLEWKWVIDSIGIGFGFKGGAYVRGHHLSDERVFTENWLKYTIDPQGLALFSRSEMDQSWQKPLYTINKELGFYWGAISGLNSGLCLWNITKSALVEAGTNSSLRETFRFFNKYADQIYPATATRAFIVLHEGLDVSDSVKFPTSVYGPASQNNTSRYSAICNNPTYAKHGAKMDDLQSATLGQVAQRDRQTGYNDAGWQIWPTNYSRFVTQIDPDKESMGLFRIGGTINATSSIYSRFARSFEHSSGRDGMYFKLHDKFFSSPANRVTLSIVYYDSVAGSAWEVKYDAGVGNFKSAKLVTETGSHTWKRETITLADAVMLHNGPNGADFALVNSDAIDDIFHSIEIERGDPVTPITIQSSKTSSSLNVKSTVQHIFYSLPENARVEIKLFTLHGKMIAHFENNYLSANGMSIFPLNEIASGSLVCRIQAIGKNRTYSNVSRTVVCK